MQRLSTRPLVILAVAALLAPGAAATWYSHGTFEPDNALDNAGFMRIDPPGTATDKIYFNVFSAVSVGVRGVLVSPNVGLIHSVNEIPAMESHSAILGVWADCNGDGYVGIVETAQREYPADLLVGSTVCPPITGPTTAWTVGAHNYNGWVSEFVPITGIPVGISTNTTDLRHYADASAMIWGDAGTPDSTTPAARCPIAPQPRGTWQSTGGTMNYLDCHADRPGTGGMGVMETANTPWYGTRLMGQDVDGLGDFAGLAFADDDNAQGSATDVDTFGSEDTQYSPVYIYDCDAEPYHSGDMLNETPAGPMVPADLQNESFFAVNPRAGNTDDPTAPAFVNHTIEGTPGIRGSADCDTSNDAGHDFYGSWASFYFGEADWNPISGDNKRESDFNFQLQFWGRGGDAAGFLEIFDMNTGETPYGGPAGAPTPGAPMTNWNPGSTNTKGDYNRVVRANLAEGDFGVPDAIYFTWYASVGTNSTSRFTLPSSSTGEYGAVQCEGYEGQHNPNTGWNCDGSLWYFNPDGSPSAEVTPRARPGQTYQMRDVDCHDGRNDIVPLGTPGFGENACMPYGS